MKVITIDGPSAAGKGTIGASLAKRLDCSYLDSGLLYRQFGLWSLEKAINLEDEALVLTTVSNHLSQLNWDYIQPDVLRQADISEAASTISVFHSIRNLANQFQRDYASAASKWVIIDGRDAGTVVFPDAMIKLFITATLCVRAKRRYEQLIGLGYSANLSEVEADILRRDLRDQTRSVAPLKPAEDAYIVDTSEEAVDQSIDRISKYLEKYLVT